MHQVIGFLACAAAGAIVLHSWDLPRSAIGGFILLCLSAAALAGAAQTLHVEGPAETVASTRADEMAPTEGFVAPPRHRTTQAMIAIW